MVKEHKFSYKYKDCRELKGCCVLKCYLNMGYTQDKTFMNMGYTQDKMFMNMGYTQDKTFMNMGYTQDKTFMNMGYTQDKTFRNMMKLHESRRTFTSNKHKNYKTKVVLFCID